MKPSCRPTQDATNDTVGEARRLGGQRRTRRLDLSTRFGTGPIEQRGRFVAIARDDAVLRILGLAADFVGAGGTFLLCSRESGLDRSVDLCAFGEQRLGAITCTGRPCRARLQRLLHGREKQNAHQLPEDDEAYELNDESYVGR